MSRNPHTLLLPPTPLVGRAAEMPQLLDLCAPQSATRLVTLCGPAGVGKSRCALEAAHRLAPAYADDVALLDLGAHNHPAALLPAIAQTLGQPLRDHDNPGAALGASLGARTLLLVLDNCEHLLDALAPIVGGLLPRAPGLHLLCTSREPLNLPGEQRLPLAPMPLPPASARDAAALAAWDVVQLFCARAAAIAPDFALTDANAAAIAAICREVDALPLAVELAAAQVRLFTPHEIAARVATDFALLTNVRSPSARHHTLGAALLWSEQLLAPPELLLLHRLAVFADSTSFAAIEAVCTDATLPADALPALLMRLVDKSLVQAQPAGAQMRYALRRTVRRSALGGLAQRGETEMLAQRHAAWYARLARAGGIAMQTRSGLAWARTFDQERENLHAALVFATTPQPQAVAASASEGDPAASNALLAANTACDLVWYWVWRNRLDEARAWATALLALPAAADSAQIRARALYVRGVAYTWAADSAADNSAPCATACAALEEALALARTADDRALLPRLRHSYALTQVLGGRLDGAHTTLSEIDAALAAQQDELPSAWQTTAQAAVRGVAARAGGDLPTAEKQLGKALQRARAVGAPFLLGALLYEVGRTEQAARRYQRAEMALREAHQLSLDAGNEPILLRTFFRLAEVLHARGQENEALDWFEAGLGHLRSRDVEPASAALYSLAFIAGEAQLWALCVTLYTAAGLPCPTPAVRRGSGVRSHLQQLDRACTVLNAAELARSRHEGDCLEPGEALEYGLETLRAAAAERRLTDATDLQLRLLGPAQVILNNKRIETSQWKYALARDLLFYLVALGERTREQMIQDFWPDVDAARARNRLNVTLHFLRKALGGQRWILFEENRYRFDALGAYRCDVDEFYSALTVAARVAQASPARALQCLEHAVALVRGEFLADITEGSWHIAMRASIRSDYLNALQQLAALQLDAGQAERAINTLSQALTVEQCDEATYRGLLRAHALRGERVQAMQVYQYLCDWLGERGAQPSAETAAVYASVLQRLEAEPL